MEIALFGKVAGDGNCLLWCLAVLLESNENQNEKIHHVGLLMIII
jgi:hypothetical protein